MSQGERDRVVEALKKSHPGVNFTVKYEVGFQKKNEKVNFY